MFIARASKSLGTATFASALGFTRRAWLGIVARSGLTLDTRFVPATQSPRRTGACLYLLRRGEFCIEGASRLRFEGPATFILSEHHLEGASGKRPITFRAAGTPWEAIEVHLAEDDLTSATAEAPIEEPHPVAVDLSLWPAAERVLDRVQQGTDAEIETAIAALLATLAREGLVARRVAEGATAPLPFERLWRAVRPLAQRFALSATMDELGALTGLSARQLDRYLHAFFDDFAMFGGGWRTATRHLRLKLAILFLSAEGVPVEEVARVVGYGSADAMSRALRDAGSESPTAIRAALRETRS